jgi:hypothetical protein
MLRPAAKYLALFIVSFSATSGIASQCGGTERWRPKVGTDVQVSQVNVDHPESIDLHDLINLTEPERPQDDITRIVPDETHVYRFTAFMLQFKEEPNDQDYHIVLTDATHKFTDHAGNSIGHSVIAEIPDPDCLQGKDQQFPGESAFASQIASARALMDQRFPTARKDGSFNPVGIQVEVTGVGFFDRPHGQIGRAPNNIEVHPILRLCFLDGPAPQCSSDQQTVAHIQPPAQPPSAPPVETGHAFTIVGPFSWSLIARTANNSATQTVTVMFRSAAGNNKTLEIDFFPGTASLPADSETTDKVVINLRLEMLGPIVQQLSSAREITVRSSATTGAQSTHALEFRNQPD